MSSSMPVQRTRIKICGITSVNDAAIAVAAGADAIGLVFYTKSARAVSIEQAAQIALSVPAFVTVTGLFVNADADEINAILKRVPLTLLQFHGDEDAAFCEQFCKPYIKAVRIDTQADTVDPKARSDQSDLGRATIHDLALLEQQFSQSRGLLLDTYQSGTPGGTGAAFDWQHVSQSVSSEALAGRYIVAGGLNADNVGRAVEQLHPYAVDVSSGVEDSPGVKSAQKILNFIQAVKAAKPL